MSHISAIVYTSQTGFTRRYAEMLAQKTGLPAPAPLAGLRDKAVRFDGSVDKEQMMAVVLDMLK